MASVAALPAFSQSTLDKLRKAAKRVIAAAEELDRFTFSEQEEIELGMAISRRILDRYGVAADVSATRYLTLVGTAVAARSSRPALPWRWIILDSDAVNAFAAPGGSIHVTRGALGAMASEAELAGVLAHEVAHVTEKHTLGDLQESMGIDLARNRAALTAGSAFFDALADRAAEAVLSGFAQREELAADRIGLELAFSTGYEARGLIEFLATLKEHGANVGSEGGLFRSHPETDTRIDTAESLIASERLVGGARLADRFADQVPYRVADASPEHAASESPGEGGAAPAPGEAGAESTARFTLEKLSDPFRIVRQEDSSEVTGAAAGRAVGTEEDEGIAGPRRTVPLEIVVTAAELEAFLAEGGLR